MPSGNAWGHFHKVDINKYSVIFKYGRCKFCHSAGQRDEEVQELKKLKNMEVEYQKARIKELGSSREARCNVKISPLLQSRGLVMCGINDKIVP